MLLSRVEQAVETKQVMAVLTSTIAQAGSKAAKASSSKQLQHQQHPLVMQTSCSVDLHLSLEYWKRHALSLQDIRKLLLACKGPALWAWATTNSSIGLSPSAVPMTIGPTQHHQQLPHMTVAGRTKTVDAIMNIIEGKFKSLLQNNPDTLTCPFDHHEPPLPVHLLEVKTQDAHAAVWKTLSMTEPVIGSMRWPLNPDTISNMTTASSVWTVSGRSVGGSRTGASLLHHEHQQPSLKASAVWQWRHNTMWCLFAFYHGYAQMMRVVPKTQEIADRIANLPPIERPFEILVHKTDLQPPPSSSSVKEETPASLVVCCTTGESMLWQTTSGHFHLKTKCSQIQIEHELGEAVLWELPVSSTGNAKNKKTAPKVSTLSSTGGGAGTQPTESAPTTSVKMQSSAPMVLD
jgi:hypothetical protein